MKTQDKTFLTYNLGEKKFSSHIDAVHAQRPNADKYTGEIVEGVFKKINASGIVSKISRDEMDMNRPRNQKNALAIDQYRETLRNILEFKDILDENGELNRNYLHIAIHGMRNRETEFEIGTSNGNSCSSEVSDWFKTNLLTLSENIGVNSNFPGVLSKIECHRNGDDFSYLGYGDFFNTIQIEINRDWRENRQTDLINFFSKLIIDFNQIF